jgi:Arc/MetJ-type ribon-helix-helix transcriptional regulator
MDGERNIMPETEKITINMSAVDLGKVDLLVQEGLYSNRTDFIRTAIRNTLDKHNVEIQQSVVRHSFVIGMLIYDRTEFEKMKNSGKKLDINIIGMLNLNSNISPELADQVIGSIQVRGIFQASDEVKKVLADRMK